MIDSKYKLRDRLWCKLDDGSIEQFEIVGVTLVAMQYIHHKTGDVISECNYDYNLESINKARKETRYGHQPIKIYNLHESYLDDDFLVTREEVK